MSVEEADTHHGETHVAGLFQHVSGKNAETTGIDRQPAHQSIFHAEVGDRMIAQPQKRGGLRSGLFGSVCTLPDSPIEPRGSGQIAHQLLRCRVDAGPVIRVGEEGLDFLRRQASKRFDRASAPIAAASRQLVEDLASTIPQRCEVAAQHPQLIEQSTIGHNRASSQSAGLRHAPVRPHKKTPPPAALTFTITSSS